MEIPKGQFVLYQPKYRTPSIFDLHEGGLFKFLPYISCKSGACLLIAENRQVSLHYRYSFHRHNLRFPNFL